MGEKTLFPVKWFLLLWARFCFPPCNWERCSDPVQHTFCFRALPGTRSTWIVEEQIFYFFLICPSEIASQSLLTRLRGPEDTWNGAAMTCLVINRRGTQKEVGSIFNSFQILPLFTTYCCSHATTNLPLSKATRRNRNSSLHRVGVNGLKSIRSFLMGLFICF